MTTRQRLPRPVRKSAQEFTGVVGQSHIYVAANTPTHIGYARADASLAEVLVYKTFADTSEPTIQLKAVNGDTAHMWIIALLPMGCIAAFIWTTPFGAKETLIARAVAQGDMTVLDERYLVNRRNCLRVMMATRHPYATVAHVWERVRNVEAAIKGLNFVSWMAITRGLSVEAITAWLEANKPGSPNLDGEKLRAELAGSGIEKDEWSVLSLALWAAIRFVHPRR